MSATPAVALTVAATDSAAGAGIAADLRTFAAHGVFGALAVTGVTAQDTVSVHALQATSRDLVAAQLDAVLADLEVRAMKTGMLVQASTVDLITERAASGSLPRLVVDPVLVSSSGQPLFGEEMLDSYTRLFAFAEVVTPNLFEAGLLTRSEMSDLATMVDAAKALFQLGPALVVVKGGRREESGESVDVCFDGEQVTMLRAPFVGTRNVHGTGCTFAASITANLALGHRASEAARRAKSFVTRAIESSRDWELGAGHGAIDQMAGWQPPEIR